jgi:small neutral amino acid transporter SnatA (MarC family)
VDQFIKPKSIDKAWIASDPAAAIVGYSSTILAVFGVFEWMGLTADQIAILGGAVLGLLASFRMYYEKGKRQKVQELKHAHEELKRKTGDFLKEAPVVKESKGLKVD